jgi:2-amino-4-hydroxy-6-hydroxymethyldihydropteridine diphosphokinase
MILIALGSNQPGPWGPPQACVTRALAELDHNGMRLIRASRLLVSAPFGRHNQPPFVNAVAQIETHAPPPALMLRLHAIERGAGRRRLIRWGPRTLDLDLLDYHGLVSAPHARLILPHPGIAGRIFVLKPLSEIAPRWKHPVSRLAAAQLLRRLDPHGEGAEI